MAQLGLGKKFKYRRGQQVSGRMPVNFQSFRITVGEQAQVYVLFQRLSQVGELPAVFRMLARAYWPGSLETCPPSPAGSRTEDWLPAAEGLIFATRAASASRGLMERAISRGVVPLGTSFLLPSGKGDLNIVGPCAMTNNPVG